MKTLLGPILATFPIFTFSQAKINDMPTTRNMKNAYIPVLQDGVNKKIPTDSFAALQDLRDSTFYSRDASSKIYYYKKSGELADPSDKSSRLNSLLSDPAITEIILASDITVNGTVDFANKKIIFKNNARIKGNGSIKNLYVEADQQKQIFDTTLTVQFLRNYEISVVWFGAVADCAMDNEVGTTDNWKPFSNAISAMYEYNGKDVFTQFYTRKLHIPAGNNRSYYFSKAVIISGNLEVYGDGELTTVMNWRRGVKGMILPSPSYPTPGYYKTQQSARRCYMHDFTISGFKGAMGSFPGFFDNISHGLVLYGGEHRVDRVMVQAWQGHGVYVYGSNESTLEDVQSNYNSGSGFYFASADANANLLLRCMAKYNAQAGAYDSSFLGNTAIQFSSAGNASDNQYQRSIVYNREKTMSYSCIKKCINVEPEHTTGWEKYWTPTLSIGYHNHPWSATTNYVPGGAVILEGQNQIGVWIGGYSEGDQFAGINNSLSFVVGGFLSGMMNSTIRHGSFPLTRNWAASNVENTVYTGLFGTVGPGNLLGWLDNPKGVYRGWQYNTANGNIGLFSAGVLNGPFFDNLSGVYHFKSSLPVGINVPAGVTPTAMLDINGSNGHSQLRLRTSYTPTSTKDPNGSAGNFSWDENYFYIKTSAGWKRAALSTF
jgi:hypothetical protein